MSYPYYPDPNHSPEPSAGSYPTDQYQDPRYTYQGQQSVGTYPSPYYQPEYAHSNHSQSHLQPPAVYQRQVSEPRDGSYLDPASAVLRSDPYRDNQVDENKLTPYYVPRENRGSSADYYEATRRDREHSRHSTPSLRDTSPVRTRELDEGAEAAEGERGLGGALAGGAAGYYLGHKKSHGILGAIGGALLGNFLENKIDERRDGHGSHSHSRHGHEHRDHSHHGQRRTHHHHHHSRSRSRSRHSYRDGDSYEG